MLLLIAVTALAASITAPAGAVTDPGPRTCSPFPVSAPPGAKVESVTASRQTGGTMPFPALPPMPAPAPAGGVPAYCDVTVTLTHPGAGDHVRVKVVLPLSGWTGRFQAVGGSGYAAGDFGSSLITAAKAGYAAASTDAGLSLSVLGVTDWALKDDGEVNGPLLTNFATRSQHDLALVGKAVTARFYGRPAAYAYWTGCSTGGMQGYTEAQRHPGDFDGILADAPAINWERFQPAGLWPQVVMNQEHTFPTLCEFAAFADAARKACGTGQPRDCAYDPARLVGATILCEGEPITISAADATVVRKIWQGPTTAAGTRLWYGIPQGASFAAQAATFSAPDGTRSGAPFPFPQVWVQDFLKKQPDFDTSTITYGEFADLFRQSQTQYHHIIGADNPDLSAFRRSGGKLITWHGTVDSLSTPQGTIDYRDRVNRTLGGTTRVDDFYRLFLAPGVDHCGGGPGPAPTDALGALVKWVEQGEAPQTLPAATVTGSGKTVTRNLCRYPQLSRYRGHGDPDAAADYRCVTP
jgi:hypothetical protein